MSSRAKQMPPRQPGGSTTRVPMAEAELEVFYRQTFLPLVRRASWKHGLSKEDARDIVQDAFLLAIAKLDSAGNPKAWLIQVVDLLSINYQRKAARRTQLAAKWGLVDERGARVDDREVPEC
jgi:DNA-directed RNA polymerase specialized sigma24 family protein